MYHGYSCYILHVDTSSNRIYALRDPQALKALSSTLAQPWVFELQRSLGLGI
jgi:hypothetical protein